MNSRTVSFLTQYWVDPDLREWSSSAQHLYLYLFTNDHVSGTAGIGCLSEDTIRFETHLSRKQYLHAVEEIGDKVRWYESGYYWVVGRAKHTCFRADGPRSPKHERACVNVLASCPTILQKDFLERYPIDTVSIPYRNPIDRESARPNQSDTLSAFPTESESESVCESESVATAPPTPPQGGGAGTFQEMPSQNNVPIEVQNLAMAAYHHLPGDLADWYGFYPPPWIPLAIKTTQEAGVKNPRYTKAILERWRLAGGPDTEIEAPKVTPDPNAYWGEPGWVEDPNAKQGEPGFLPYDQRKWTI